MEFKVQLKNTTTDCYYRAKLDLPTLNKILYTYFKETKEVFNFYDKMINKQKVKLVEIKEKNAINLYFKNIVNFDEEKDTNIELEKANIKDDTYLILLNKINSLKKKLDSKNEKVNEDLLKENEIKLKEYIDKKINETKQEMVMKYEKILNEKIKEKDNEIKILKEEINKLKTELEKIINQLNDKQSQKKEEREKDENYLKSREKMLNKLLDKKKQKNLNTEKSEKNSNFLIDLMHKKIKERKNQEFIKYNDNINLINDFINFDATKIKNIKVISNDLYISYTKSVSVYKIIRNKEVLYEIAYPEYKYGCGIAIYNLISNIITNRIKNAHENGILQIKHYYYSSDNIHLLLTSSKDKSVKLWNICSEQIYCFLNIKNCFDGDFRSPFCMMFINDDYYIFGGSYEGKKNIWNKKGVLIGNIEKSNLNVGAFIETSYIDNMPYIILSGQYHSESYDYSNNNLKMYSSKNNNEEHIIAHLFKNDNIIYLICGDLGGMVIIFDFMTTNEIGSISVGGSIYSLCSIKEKYILVGKFNGELAVIDFDNKSIVKKYQAHKKYVAGIEKFKTQDSQEFIITYDSGEIKIWQ